MTEYAWLIERGQPEGRSPSVWASAINDSTGSVEWTEDANQALRFDTKTAAEVQIKQFLMHPHSPGSSARAVEHGWMS